MLRLGSAGSSAVVATTAYWPEKARYEPTKPNRHAPTTAAPALQMPLTTACMVLRTRGASVEGSADEAKFQVEPQKRRTPPRVAHGGTSNMPPVAPPRDAEKPGQIARFSARGWTLRRPLSMLAPCQLPRAPSRVTNASGCGGSAR